MQEALENFLTFFPVFLTLWGLFYFCAHTRPDFFGNCILLMEAAVFSLFFLSSLFGPWMTYALRSTLIETGTLLLAAPVLLIQNGIVMIRKEGAELSNMLSLILGVLLIVGEAAFLWVMQKVFSGSEATGKMFGFSVFIGFSAFYVGMLLLSFVLYVLFLQLIPHRRNFRYLIIHGCGLNGTEPGQILKDRLDKAISVYRKSWVRTTLICSGGQGDDEVISEADAMANYLIRHGIPEQAIIREDRSTTTMENLTESFRILEDLYDGILPERGARVALISSNYHIYRCMVYAHQLGRKATGIGAHVAFYYWPSAVIREFAAIFSKKKALLGAAAGYAVYMLIAVKLLQNMMS